MLESDLLGDTAAHRDADQMGLAHVEGVEQADRVGRQIHPGVVRLAGRRAGRTTRVAVVVADHVSAPSGDPLTELVLPPVHRGGRAADQQHDWVIGRPEGLGAQLDPVHRHDPFRLHSNSCPTGMASTN
jgi:hypothetical protein